MIKTGMKMTVIQAPSANFATRTTMTVTPVTIPPRPFTRALFRQCGPRFFLPVHDHAELRERKGQEGADGVERDQLVRDATEKNQQEAGQGRENDDAVGVHQTAAAIDKSMRQVIVLRDGAAETRKIGERGVRGKRKNQEDGYDS